MDISIIFLFLGIICWGTLWYLQQCQTEVKSQKTKIIRAILVVSVIWLMVSPVDWPVLVGEPLTFGRTILNYSISFWALFTGAALMMCVVYPVLSFVFQCEMDEILKDFLS